MICGLTMKDNSLINHATKQLRIDYLPPLLFDLDVQLTSDKRVPSSPEVQTAFGLAGPS